MKLLAAQVLILTVLTTTTNLVHAQGYASYNLGLGQCWRLNEKRDDEDDETRRAVFMLWLGGFFLALNIVTGDVVLRDKELHEFSWK